MQLRYLIFLLFLSPIVLFGQNYPSQEQFGKNRIQHHRFDWKILKTSNFEIYHYDNATPLATLTAQYAESEFDRINDFLSYLPINKIKIFIYNSAQELGQSNMGMANLGNLNDKELDLAKSRLEIAFTGDQVQFRTQLVKEIALLTTYDMLYGGNVREVLQSSLLMSLPEWYVYGIANYIAEGWTTELDDYMRQMVQKESYKKPSLLTGQEAVMVGQSIWNYIAERYGKDQISSILNLTRLTRTEQTSISSSLQLSYSRFLKEWREFYLNMANSTNADYKKPMGDWQKQIGKVGGSLASTHAKISADGKFLVTANSQGGRYKVELTNLETKAKTLIAKGKMIISKKRYISYTPLVAWQTSKAVAVIVNSDDAITLRIFDVSDNKKTTLRLERYVRDINQVSDFDISDEGGTLVLSADRDGKNDIYLFNVGRASLLGLTNDLYDDRYPQFVGNSSNKVVFCSNRLKDTLAIDKGTYKTIKNKLGLFIHDGNPRSPTVRRVLDTLGSISRPMTNDGNTFYFLSDYEGVNNFYKYEANLKTATQLTGYSESIYDYDYAPATNAFVSVHRQAEAEYINLLNRLSPSADLSPTPRVRSIMGMPTYKTEQKINVVADAKIIEQMGKPNPIKLDSGEVNTDHYEFDADVVKQYENRLKRGVQSYSANSSPIRNRRRDNFTIKGPTDYKGLFISNDSRSDVLIDPIKGFGYSQSITMNDLLENHIVKAGFFVSSSLRNNDIWAEYSNLAHRIDFSARFDRRSLFVNENSANQKYRYNRLAVTAAYPISNTTRFSVSPFFANTNIVDVNSIAAPDAASSYLGARVEFVYDNSTVNGMNMMEGSRFKIRYDMFGGLANAKSFNRFVIDARRYQKIHRDVILAGRLSFSYSAGNSPKKSVLGGMENWIGFSREVKDGEDPLAFGNNRQGLPIDNQNVYFLEFATNLRGFNLGHVSGTSHLLMNTELRVPLIKYLYRGPITSNFLRNFQVVAFTDIGTAWSGKSPIFNRKNTLNTEPIVLDFFSATVTNFRNPFLVGYGLGVRTMLFGYYAKFDYAWGLDNGEVGKPIAYLTLGYDF